MQDPRMVTRALNEVESFDTTAIAGLDKVVLYIFCGENALKEELVGCVRKHNFFADVELVGSRDKDQKRGGVRVFRPIADNLRGER